MAGLLALVVGPSGAGKDALIAAARAALVDDRRFLFVRRVVTRAAVAAAEDHETVDPGTFAALRREGAFALSWEAHGLGYGLPASTAEAVTAGRIVVANVSRHVVAEASTRFPVHVLLIEAPPALRAARLGARRREDPAAIAARLARTGDGLPAVPLTRIDNSGTLEAGTAAFVAALRALARTAREGPQPEERV